MRSWAARTARRSFAVQCLVPDKGTLIHAVLVTCVSASLWPAKEGVSCGSWPIRPQWCAENRPHVRHPTGRTRRALSSTPPSATRLIWRRCSRQGGNQASSAQVKHVKACSSRFRARPPRYHSVRAVSTSQRAALCQRAREKDLQLVQRRLLGWRILSSWGAATLVKSRILIRSPPTFSRFRPPTSAWVMFKSRFFCTWAPFSSSSVPGTCA